MPVGRKGEAVVEWRWDGGGMEVEIDIAAFGGGGERAMR